MISWISKHKSLIIVVFIAVVVGFIILLTVFGITPHLERIALILMIIEIILLLIVIILHNIEIIRRKPGIPIKDTPGFDVIDIMNLSESMRRTVLALATFGEAAPEKIARKTKQPVSTEKANLDSLVRMGYAMKVEGKKEYKMV